MKVITEFPNVWGEYHGNPYIQGTTVPCDMYCIHTYVYHNLYTCKLHAAELVQDVRTCVYKCIYMYTVEPNQPQIVPTLLSCMVA